MDDTRIVRFPGNLDPRAVEFTPRTSSLSTQLSHLGPLQMYYTYPSSTLYPTTNSSTPTTGHPMMRLYDGTVDYHQFLPASEPFFRPANQPRPPPPPPPTLPSPSPAATRALLLSSVPTDVSETTVRRELEVFGEVRSVQMEKLQVGIVTVHFYDLRHAEAALAEIQEQHMQQQRRLRQHYTALQKHYIDFSLPPPAPGLIAGWAVWAQFTMPDISAAPDGCNQGTLVIFNLDLEVSSSKLKKIFEAFGPVKELRETPLKRHQRFVEFYDIRDAAKALSEMNGKEIIGKHVKIEFSRIGSHGRRSSSHYMNNTGKNPSPKLPSSLPLPPRLPPRLLGLHSSQSQTLCVTKNPSCREDAGSNQRSNHAGMTAAGAGQGLLSLTIVGNRSEGEGDSSGTSRNLKKGNRSGCWKSRHERPDAQFLIHEDSIVESDIKDTRTTVMIKNIPNKYSQKLLLNLLDNHCIHCNEQIADGDSQPLSSYDFVYLPIDFLNKCNVGYGFVNLTSPQAALRLYKAFHMRPWEVFNSRKICQVTYARLQGLEVLKEHFRNSQFACNIDEYLPVVFSPPRDGMQLSEPVTIASPPKLAVISKGLDGRVRAGKEDDGMEGRKWVGGGGGGGVGGSARCDDDE